MEDKEIWRFTTSILQHRIKQERDGQKAANSPSLTITKNYGGLFLLL